ncbi:ribosome maturation factor RimM [Propionibacterium sp.]|uniref:ribosome maturation factor RimM n=1 Tax=Propionibacterium sp. TaxID=1977903 RepID=UPI0039ED8D66
MAGTIDVVVAVVGRAHGVRGEVNLTVRTDEPDRRVAPGKVLMVEGTGRTLTVSSAHWSSGHLQVRFAEAADRTQVEALRGAVLMAHVDETERPEDDDEYYDRQLVGLGVHDAAGKAVGTVADVLHLPAQDLLSITTEDGERLVPLVRALVPEIDLEAGVLKLADVPGLVDDRALDDGTGGGA